MQMHALRRTDGTRKISPLISEAGGSAGRRNERKATIPL